MFKVGDLVQHKTTGIKGKIVGFGHRKTNDDYYCSTLKVELLSHYAIRPIAEDSTGR